MNLVLVFFFVNNVLLNNPNGQSNIFASTSLTETSIHTPTKLQTESIQSEISGDLPIVDLSQSDIPLYVISIYFNQKSQLYAFHPDGIPFTRLIDEPYEEIHPSTSHDNKKIAYSAKKNGYWDIYILDLTDGSETRVTDSPEYDGSPTWSSDGLYLAYESYLNGNLDIFIQDLQNLDSIPIQLTNGDDPQHSPSWSPNGREIAFVSTQDGNEDIWLAKLDAVENRFIKVADRPEQADINPFWSIDGGKLLWTSENNGYPVIIQADFSNSNILVSEVGNGDLALLTSNLFSFIQLEANQNFLISKDHSGQMIFPSIEIPGNVHGFSVIDNYKKNDFLVSGLIKNSKLLVIKNGLESDPSSTNKIELVLLENVVTEYPYLSNSVYASFNELRSSVATSTGWDFLNQLDKTFIPITDPATPGTAEEWLYTGRAFEFNPLSIHAGLTTTIKEERNGQTYWRVYIKARYQDGSQGMPLKQMPFDLSGRFNNDPRTYESGGMKIPIPEGYWIDLTELVGSHSWERVPAIGNWQKYFDSARFNQFVYSDGLDWYAAMKELYPIEAFKSPTPIPTNPLTPTVSPTIRYYRSPTITSTPTETFVPTRRPTWTPQP
ncbi:MAG: PD40 domain-containing protein [Anaerolineaceae bacterium]|nr:PD40 domain-containing protein [Anaerolineaceae bacterium]